MLSTQCLEPKHHCQKTILFTFVFHLQVTMYEEGQSKVMFFFWLHSAFLTAPPSDMGGVARPLTVDECAEAGLKLGVWTLKLKKYEIDRASKDKRCAHFDPDFWVEVFFTPLPGESGTGPSLAAVRAKVLAAKGTETQDDEVERPLHMDREGYQQYIQALSNAGHQNVSFQSWLLGMDPGPFSSVPASVAISSKLESDFVFGC
jgi:hypothetical protein